MNTGIYGALALLIIVVVFWFIMTVKAFKTLNHSATEGFMAVDFYFGRRRNLVDDLTRLVKKQMPGDEEIVQNVIDANRIAKEAYFNIDKLKTEGVLADTLDTLFIAAEKHTELAESKNYLSLKEKIEDANANILKAGRLYNSVVKMHNHRIKAFPTRIVARMLGYEEHPML